MREIKFRTWYENRMRPINTWGFAEGFITTPKASDDQEEFEVMQYTGLKDKNGVEIYENDIVKASFWDDDIKVVSEIASVEFEDGSFILRLPRDEWSYFNGAQSIEVIGNRNENPEFLEGAK